jgi:hypothetical protein
LLFLLALKVIREIEEKQDRKELKVYKAQTENEHKQYIV